MKDFQGSFLAIFKKVRYRKVLLLIDEEFRKKYPNLAREIEENLMSIKIDCVRSDLEEAEKAANIEHYEPTVIDFLRRCDTEEEGLEVIEYLEKRGEISKEYATKLKIQLLTKGIRSFGEKKEPGYYYRFFGFNASEDD